LCRGSLAAGEHRLTWNGLTAAGQVAAPGIYLVRLDTPAGARTRRLIVLR